MEARTRCNTASMVSKAWSWACRLDWKKQRDPIELEKQRDPIELEILFSKPTFKRVA
jgi:hypothetical protein